MPHVMGDHERRHIGPSGFGEPCLRVAMETDGGADEREIVEDITANGGVRRRSKTVRRARLGRRRDGADGATADTARAEFQITVEAVVELGPRGLAHEFLNAGLGPRRQPGGQPVGDVLNGGREKMPGLAGGLNFGEGTHGD